MKEPTTALEQFIALLRTAFEASTFVKCTLSRPVSPAMPDIKAIYLRPVEIKHVRKIAFTYRFKTRDEVKNYTLAETLAYLETALGKDFLNGDLFTTEQDHTLSFDKKGQAHLQSKPASQTILPDIAHNRQKHRLLDPSAPWLHQLGITSTKGEVLAASQDKWKQINKFLEIIESLLRENPLPADAHIVDMGAGKGYLTFALYDYLTNNKGLQVQITGIELRGQLVDFCSKVAAEAGFSGLHFVAEDIRNFAPPRLDMLIALHACDIATDLAIAKGVVDKASIIVVAPCCHKQIRRAMATRNELEPVLRHGILEERQAEIVTDGIRALLLEASGYSTKVFEFISTEHTAKNVMITALKSDVTPTQKAAILQKIEAIKIGFGIDQHYLEGLI